MTNQNPTCTEPTRRGGPSSGGGYDAMNFTRYTNCGRTATHTIVKVADAPHRYERIEADDDHAPRTCKRHAQIRANSLTNGIFSMLNRRAHQNGTSYVEELAAYIEAN